MTNHPFKQAVAELNRPRKAKPADRFTPKELERIAAQGFVDLSCQCGEGYRLEPDGETTCTCGKHLESPLVTLGYI